MVQNCTDAQLAYMAGFIDGEGYITISKRHATTKWRQCGYTLTIVVSQINPEPLRMLKDSFGGHLRHEIISKPNHRSFYTWQVSSAKALAVLIALKDFLIVKKEEALLGLEFQATIGKPFERLSVETLEKREFFYAQMKDLKDRVYE